MSNIEEGSVASTIEGGIATVLFGHPKGNSLPGALLKKLAGAVSELGADSQVRVIVLRSLGEKTFCGGAAFDELTRITSAEQGKEFFMGFARLILAIRRVPKFVVCRVQGRAVGGGVGVIAACDHALALSTSAVRLSELAIGIGPFVVGPVIERRIGRGAFGAMAIDADWRSAEWAAQHGLFAALHTTPAELELAVDALAKKLARSSPEAMAKLKQVLWEGSEHWEALLEQRAAYSGSLVLSDFSRNAINAAQA